MGRGLSPALAVVLLLLVPAGAGGDPICDGHWRRYPNNIGKPNNALHGSAVIDTQDAWAVGYQQRQNGTQDSLIERFDGSSWAVVQAPNIAGTSVVLNDVDNVASDDVWAVGRRVAKGVGHTLVLHRTGGSWSVVSSPDPSETSNVLNGVSAASADDVWAVGTQTQDGKVKTLVEHWNGTAWSVVGSPNPGWHFNILEGVDAVSSDLAWAAGRRQGKKLDRTLLLRWDGKQWLTEDVRPPGTFSGVWGRGTTDAWAAGPPAEHWAGPGWSETPLPGTPPPFLNGVSGRSRTGVWAVGSRPVGDTGTTKAAIVRWTGTKWIAAPNVPSPGQTENDLLGVAASEPFVWAVGYRTDKTVIRKALILGVC